MDVYGSVLRHTMICTGNNNSFVSGLNAWIVVFGVEHEEYVCRAMYVCIVITYSRVWINRVRLPILLVVSWTGKIVFPCPRACLRIWSRETGSAVPSRVSLFISILRLNLVLTYGIPPEFRGGVHLWNRHTPSGQSRVYRVTQLRTDGVHCRQSAGTGPVNLKVVPNGCGLGRYWLYRTVLAVAWGLGAALPDFSWSADHKRGLIKKK